MKKTTKADVYSFGVLMLEIICGRKVSEHDPSSKNTKSLLDDVSDRTVGFAMQNVIRDDVVA